MNDEKAAKSGNPDDYTCRITSVKNCPSLRIGQLGPTNIVLDYVRAVHVDLSTRRDKHIWHFSLSGVPKFLVDAFKFLEDANAFRMDGIFRKEGNASRLKNAWTIYCGIAPLPLECTVHDVCSLIKRFFREIKTPIFDDCQANILKFAESLNNNEETVFKAISAVVERLPAVNAATLTFLLKQLRKVSEYADSNRMTAENLATVFAPSLFRDDNPIAKSTKKKKDDQFHLMNFVRSRNNLQISVVKLLISKSHLLCPPREVKLTRHSSEHYTAGKKKANLAGQPSITPTRGNIRDENASPAVGDASTQSTANASLLDASLSIDFDDSDFVDTPLCKSALKRSQSAKSSIQRVMSLRERSRNVNYAQPPAAGGATNLCLRSTSVWHQKPRIAAALAELRDYVKPAVSAVAPKPSLARNRSSFVRFSASVGGLAAGRTLADYDEKELNVERPETIVQVPQIDAAKPSAGGRPARPPPPKIASASMGELHRDENASGGSKLARSKLPFQQVQPAYAFRRTRAFVSDYEKICTRCDVRGHLMKECPKASVCGMDARPPWK